MKIALAQINPTVGDFTGNLAKIFDFALRAQALGAELVVYPELAVCGYWPADLMEKATFLERSAQALDEIREWTAGAGRPAVLCGGVLPVEPGGEGKSIRNVARLMAGGQVLLTQAKALLPFYDVFDEQRYFEPAASQSIVTLKGQPLAITICEDAWNDKGYWPRRLYDRDPVEALMLQYPPDAPRIILNLSASPFWQGKRGVRSDMLCALARRYGAFVAITNQCGGNDSLLFDGTSVAFGPDGALLGRGRSFEQDLVVFDTASPVPVAPEPEDDTAGTWDALVLGIRDYVAKCGFAKVLIGISGGIDSALVAALAVAALGAENVVGVVMPSQYSSQGSRDDAVDLAEALGIQWHPLPIEPVYQAAMATLSPVFEGTPFGLAEENLQSRIRGMILMALSNKTGALVLSTGNKSEMSVGYCTLYGDMAGALAVIGDVMKVRVYALARYCNRRMGRIIIPESTLSKPPSAELRPEQKDTDSLPPYEVLDPILTAYVEQYQSAEQIAGEQGVDLALVRQILKLVERSEYKRQQAAPVLKVTQKSFGPGRRFPIAVKYQV